MTKVLIDTDVILDVFFDRNPFVSYAAEVLSKCEKKELQGYITPVILSNVYYLLRQNSTHEKVIETLKLLVSFLDILIIDRNSVSAALNSNFKDFEDALQNFSALHNGNIDLILTRNVKDFKSSTLAVMTPEVFLKMKV